MRKFGMRRLLSLLLVFAMTFSMLSGFAVQAEEAVQYTVKFVYPKTETEAAYVKALTVNAGETLGNQFPTHPEWTGSNPPVKCDGWISGGVEITADTVITNNMVVSPKAHDCSEYSEELKEVAATCTETGLTEGSKCSVCGEILVDQEEIPVKGHVYEAGWTASTTEHFHECIVCKDKADAATHIPGPGATETDPQLCTVCSYIMNAALGHQCVNHLTKVDGKAATCKEDGNTVYYACECNKLYEDAEAKKEVTLEEVTVAATGHDYDVLWSASPTEHWHECTVCGDKAELGAHTAGPGATETEDQKCTVCSYIMNAALGHQHAKHLTKVEEVKATATKDGNKAYYVCECGKYFADAEGTMEISLEDVVTKATGENANSDSESGYKAPDTGDSSNMMLWMTVAVMAMAAVVCTSKKRIKK